MTTLLVQRSSRRCISLAAQIYNSKFASRYSIHFERFVHLRCPTPCASLVGVSRRQLHASTSACFSTDSHTSPTAIDDKQPESNGSGRKTDVLLNELIGLIDTGRILLIDVREEREIEETGSIPNSINIPVTQLKASLLLSDDEFLSRFGVSKPRKDATDVVYYGLSGVKSAIAVEIAQRLGYRKARHYIGGWDEWSLKCRNDSLS